MTLLINKHNPQVAVKISVLILSCIELCTLRKHAYSNIHKSSPPKPEKLSRNIRYILHTLVNKMVTQYIVFFFSSVLSLIISFFIYLF